MNTAHLKNYAPKARQDFIAAVTARAAIVGLTAKHIEPIAEQGDVALIGDKAFPRTVAAKRKRLEDRIRQQGFDQVMEAMAYTWFNRLMAIRYMELHGYLDHSRRVLSHPDKKNGFEILDDCAEIELPGVDRDQVVELKLAGNKDEELYRTLLLGQCHALQEAMPFLFEAIDDETELLLPDNLTKTDSLIRHLVDDIPEDNWDQIEIIGWLYQFYISEKKDQVIGKVVKSEDIPAATQLFTPNWIVKYMVQNSLGAQWLATYPDSKIKGQMEYYIEPAEQTDEVNQQLKAITPTSLNPEELTLIDPASGSGHILVEAYELFKAIYLERGYRQRDIPQLILEKNLFGLEICPRAAQLTGFALMMKGRSDDRRLFEKLIELNVMALQDSINFDAERVIDGIKLADHDLQPKHLTGIKKLFEHATTFGSLIQVPDDLKEKLPQLKQLSEATSQDLFVSEALKRLAPVVNEAQLLAAKYDAVVANPPYMGGKSFNSKLRGLIRDSYRGYHKDLFAAFIVRLVGATKAGGHTGVMTSFVWMFISSYELLRSKILADETIDSLVQLHYDAFADAKAHVCTFTLKKRHIVEYKSAFVRLADFPGVENQAPRTLDAIENRDCGWFFETAQQNFKNIPGAPIAYWLSENVLSCFASEAALADVGDFRSGMATGDNDRFLRYWYEISRSRMGISCASRDEAVESKKKWFPYCKGGGYRKWYGNNEYLVNFENDGFDIKTTKAENLAKGLITANNSKCWNQDRYFAPSVTWSSLTSGRFATRLNGPGFVFDTKGQCVFTEHSADRRLLNGLLNSEVVSVLLKALCPTLDFNAGAVAKIPFPPTVLNDEVRGIVDDLVTLARSDWDAAQTSWDFQSLPLLTASSEPTPTLESSYTAWITQNRDTIAEMKRLEEENNRLFIDAYGLGEELTPDVPIEQITLTVNPAYRCGGKLTEAEQWIRFRQDTMEELVSYAIGCMMARYSLDAPGLIYAHSGNEGFDPSRYPTFPADDDGIVPITDTDWFADDACNRLIEFISVALDESRLEENVSFLANNLSPKKNESSRETIRRYLCDKFFKAHLQTYKKRPIYWLFSSGKQKAFQCLVYLHRYNEGTLARMRTAYVIPLQGKISSRIEQLDNDIAAASSTAHRKKLEKERDKLAKQRVELQEFDEKLRHYADQRIHLDLDDGVKVNYAKFGDLLAEAKAVTGKKAV